MINKQSIKRSLNPLVIVTIKVMHFSVFGKSVFANKYTRNLPGISLLLRKIDSRVRAAQTVEDRRKDYQRWFKKNYPNKTLLSEQKIKQNEFKNRPLISLLVPTYNTEISHLKECIESVINQTYDNWQLCIADDASTKLEVRETIKGYASKDKRIKFVFREANGHICEASNSALNIARGEYVGLLDHDDTLWPNALFEVVKIINANPTAKFIYSDEDKTEFNGNKHCDPFFKPDWSFNFLRSINYITHFAVLDRELVNKIGGFRKGYEGAQDWDLFLRASRQVDKAYHIPKVIYSWRKSPNSTAQSPSSKDYAYINQKKALKDDIRERGLAAKLSWQIPYSMWRIDYKVKDDPLVSIIIPTKDQYDFIKRCLGSIDKNTLYTNFEVVIVDTGSSDERVWKLYDEFESLGHKTQVVKWKKPFNFAAACDFGAEKARGEYFLFLNNDTEVIDKTWIEDMLGYAQQKHIGAVGCKLYYPDRRLQHAGIILGVGGQNDTPGIAGHFFPAFIDSPPQDPAQLTYIGGTRDFAAVTAACLMVSKEKFENVEGFDPIFQIAFNDVDFCLKLLDKGYDNVYLPHVTLYHHESISVGQPGSKQRNLEVFAKEIELMLEKWGDLIKNDPFYHPDFRRDIASARLKIN